MALIEGVDLCQLPEKATSCKTRGHKQDSRTLVESAEMPARITRHAPTSSKPNGSEEASGVWVCVLLCLVVSYDVLC